ncbi:uncharacterized protein BN594_00084 [Bacteroides uniformis CAG:3]|nr:uncharacterized protein BN594_00084 [Bacteroides uniformis CAG:3]
MLYFQESVRMVVAVSIHFRAGCFSACRVGMGHCSRLVCKSIDGSCYIITTQRITLHSLHHTSLDVVVVCRINLVAATEYRCHTCRQCPFPVARSIIREIAVIETCLRTESVVVIVIPDVHSGARSSHFVGAYTLIRQTVQAVVLVVRPVTGCKGTLVAVLREYQAVGIVIHHFHISRTGKLLPDTTVTSVVFVLEGIQVEIGQALVHRLEHETKIAFVVIHIVSVVRFAALHLTGQYNMSHLVGEGVAHVQIFIGGFNDRKLAGSIAAVARQCACTAYAIVDAVQLRVSRTVGQIVRIDGMPAMPCGSRSVFLDGTVQRRSLVHRLAVRTRVVAIVAGRTALECSRRHILGRRDYRQPGIHGTSCNVVLLQRHQIAVACRHLLQYRLERTSQAIKILHLIQVFTSHFIQHATGTHIIVAGILRRCCQCIAQQRHEHIFSFHTILSFHWGL